jgi:hypothetical protein
VDNHFFFSNLFLRLDLIIKHLSFSQWQELSGDTQYAGVPSDSSGSGWQRYTAWALALQLALRELQYVLQDIVILTNIDYKQLILVFF